MKNFFKSFFTSCLGTIVGILALVFGSIFIVGLFTPSPTVSPNSILTINLGASIPELTDNVDQGGMDLDALMADHIGLAQILKTIDLAKEDDKIKGIYLEMSGVNGGFATMKSIREKLQDFQSTGKFVTAYSTGYSQKAYYLASVADNTFLHPLGSIDFRGFAAQLMFFKGMMDKVGVDAQIYYAGKFKSATEPFRRTDMSEPNRIQVSRFLNEMYNIYLEAISEERGIEVEKLRTIANEFQIQKAEDALEFRFVDALLYKDQVLDNMRNAVGLTDDEKIQFVSVGTYISRNPAKFMNLPLGKDQVAVVVAEGSIVDGEGKKGSIGGDKYARIIRKIRQDDNVKAIVLRVNSGGGSALASDIIWRELELAKEQGIRVIASMGDVAASGGYYISSGADRIFAEANTITGSIGVFGMIPNARELMETKMGLTMDTVKTGKFAAMDGLFYGFNEEEAAFIQRSVDTIYTIFKTRVYDGRSEFFTNIGEVDSVAQGRVWLGTDALANGLIDTIGGLNAAITTAANDASLTDYEVQYYPNIPASPLKALAALTGEDSNDDDKYAQIDQSFQMPMSSRSMIEEELGEEFAHVFDAARMLKEMKGVQMRMPYMIEVE